MIGALHNGRADMAGHDTGPLDQLEQLGAGNRFHDTLCEMLEGVRLFADLSRPEIERLARHVQAYEAPVGATLIREGGRDGYMCVLVKGRAEIRKEDANFQPRRITEVRAGSTIGEMSVLDDQPHSASAVAREPCTVLILTREQLKSVGDEDPKLGLAVLWRIARLMSLRLRQTSGMLIGYLETQRIP